MPPFQEIDIHKVKEMVDQKSAHIVDIRDPGSYSSGHIPSAVPVNDDTVKEFTENTDKEKPLVVCCYHGISSQGAAAYFAEQGFREVYSMTGGFEAWRGVYPAE
ncbi:MAG: thiosulfate sulfurtransferase GlpE [Nitrospinaceae bacterium]|nr:MAG: thiosulfate sulfurtransferase GlpE [Nitrospinaceae bacterium]